MECLRSNAKIRTHRNHTVQYRMIALIAASTYVIESIFGFGGTILFMAIAGNFLDFKTLIDVSLLVASTASATIVLHSARHIVLRQLWWMLAISLPGVILGAYMVEHLAGDILLKIFAVILIFFGLQGLIKPHLTLPDWAEVLAVIVGGLSQGLFSTGGPFMMLGMRERFANRRQIRATFACFFLATNLWRMAQFYVLDSSVITTMQRYVWVCIPVMLAVMLGYAMHLRISERSFKRGLNILFLCAGVAYLVR